MKRDNSNMKVGNTTRETIELRGDTIIDGEYETYYDPTNSGLENSRHAEFFTLQTPSTYPDNNHSYKEVLWKDIFMPFDVIKGLDNCPPDNSDYNSHKKTHWWVCPKTKKDTCNVHDISMFMDGLEVREFETLDEALNFCFQWRDNWLRKELKKTTLKKHNHE